MKQTLEDVQVKYDHPITINSDNTSAINISKNPVMHCKTKHILIKYHFLREHVSQKVVKVEYIDNKEKIAYIFTKPLPRSTFQNLIHKLGVIPIPHLKLQKKREEHMDRGSEEMSLLSLLLKGENTQ
jgi:hypothetical protein